MSPIPSRQNFQTCRVGEQTMYEIGQQSSSHHVLSMIKHDMSADASKLSVFGYWSLRSTLCCVPIHFVSTNASH